MSAVLYFFFKQKTAYEMRISDWSSDVCSSDLPGAHGAREGRVDIARHQSAHGKGKGDRKADIAEIQRRRMESEAGVLQQRIETLSVRRRRLQALERVGGKEQEGIEAKAERKSGVKGTGVSGRVDQGGRR